MRKKQQNNDIDRLAARTKTNFLHKKPLNIPALKLNFINNNPSGKPQLPIPNKASGSKDKERKL